MTTRKAAFKDEENPNKQRRISNDDSASFTTLNNDCLLGVASFLPVSDLNNFAMVNRLCSQVRNHESLNQTREATIICSRKENARKLLNAALNTATSTLSANYTQFTVLGLELIPPIWLGYGGERLEVSPNNAIRRIELGLNSSITSGDDGRGRDKVHWSALDLLARHFPNVNDLVLKDAKYGPAFRRPVSKKLTRLEFPPMGSLSLPVLFCNDRDSRRIIDLIADGCIFQHSFDAFGSSNYGARMRLRREMANAISNEEPYYGQQRYLLMDFPRVERVSLKGAMWRLHHEDTDTVYDAEPLSQAMLMKMVRRHPTLRWLRSDLCERKVAILKSERPEITFVSE